MKRSTIVWQLFMLALTLCAEPVTSDQAYQVARSLFREKSATLSASGTTGEAEWTVSPLIADSQATVGFLVERECGYVLVRADTDCPPIKFYADSGTYEGLPPTVRAILEKELEAELAFVRSTEFAFYPKSTVYDSEWGRLLGEASTSATGPIVTAGTGTKLLTTAAWNQGVPYNLYCPAAVGGPGGRAWAGCASAAMAIILRYHCWPDAITSDHTDPNGGYKASDVGLGAYEWSNMPTNDLELWGATVAQQQAVAKLIYHCSILGNMSFGADGSGGWVSSSRIRTHLKYTCTELQYMSGFTLDQWMTKVRADIDAGHPLYWIVGSGGGNSSHAVVCDGYDDAYTVHFNFGWAGSYTGWYDIRNTINAYTYTFSTDHSAVFEIAPTGHLPAMAPVITTHPSDDIVPGVGCSVTFSVAASGFPFPTFQWQKDGVNIPGETQSTLRFIVNHASNAGQYRAIATNSEGSAVSKAATLTIGLTPEAAPAITAHPTSRTVMAGTSVAFSVSASGYPEPTIRWQKDGSDIAGATGATLTINPVQASHAGTYRAIATNGAGSATSDGATLTVTIPPAPPSIVVGVISQTLDAGTTASFGVTAAGDAPLSYQWAFNGTDIPGATSATYSVVVADATAGTYRVTVTNAVGSATSSGTLAVKAPSAAPAITTQPINQTVNAGSAAEFTVGASGYPYPTFRWQKDGTDLPGATGATLRLTNVQPSAAGQYRAIATNSEGSATSTAATLTVTTQAPAITTQPGAQTTTVGSSFSFTVAATGLPAPTYQWRKDGTAIAGATAASYGKSTASLADAGDYSVVVTNLAGSVTSAVAALTVNPAPSAPSFTTQPVAQSAYVGGTASFTVVVAGYPAPTLQWTKNGVAIPGATAATLALSNVQYGDAANYAVVAANASGSRTSTAVALTVEAAPTAPVITGQPTGGTAGLGATVRLTVTATGNPTPTYQWRKDGVALAGATAATLTLSSLRLTDAGTYTVLVSNSQGSVTSANAVVAVQYAPSITKQPVALSVSQGSPASFSVEATGHPAPTYQWKARGAVIPGATAATYSIASAQPADAGNYQVVVTNASGSATSESVALTITTGPSITTEPADVGVLAGANVDFSVVTNGTPPITYQWYMNGALAAGHTSASFGAFKAEGYHDGTTFKVVVTNALGSTTSRTATLRVGVPAAPAITTQPADLIAAVGATADFSVEASGVPTPTFQWYLNDTLVSGSTKPNFGAFTVANFHDGYTFKCVVTNASGSVTTRSAKLMVGVPTAPSITTQPADLLIPAGTSADFAVVAAGIPAPTYQWFLNGQIVDGRTAANYGAFTAEPYHDGMLFSCLVTNASGAVTTRSAKLTIAVPSAPVLVKQPANLTAQVGDPADFSVEATGYPAPTYQWYLNDTPMAGHTAANFGTFTVAAFHAGWTFKCVVTNANGTVTSQTATLAVGTRPVIGSQSQAVGVTHGQPATLTLSATGATGFQWYKGGVAVTGATGASLSLPTVGSAEAGIYDCTVTGPGGATLSAPVVLGVVPAAGQRTAGAVSTRDTWQNIHHPNGATYDQFLLTGTAGTFTADPGEIARMSYLDPQGSIVQVEMSGAGAITVVLDPTTASGPKAPALYNQSGIEYMQGKATIILSGADASTHFTIYSVGTFTNPGVTKPDVNYAGWADVAASGIVSTDGGLGGIHQGNVGYNATVGLTGIYAPTVTNVPSLIVVHGIAAGGTAQPYLLFGQGGNATIKIAGTSLAQPNGDDLTVDGLAKVTMGAGQDSCGRAAPAQAVATRLVDPAGNDVTAAVVAVGP